MEWKQFPSAEEQNRRIAELEAENQRLMESASKLVKNAIPYDDAGGQYTIDGHTFYRLAALLEGE